MNTRFASRARYALLLGPALILASLAIINGHHVVGAPEKPRKLFTPKPPSEGSNVPPAPTFTATATPAAEALPPELQPFNPKGIGIYYIGNRNSEIEPCGCVKNQLGGIQYEGTLYNQIPSVNGLRLEVGGWVARSSTPEALMKIGYALQAIGGELAFDSVNVSGVDAGMGKSFFDKLKTEHPEAVAPLISANLMTTGTQETAFPPYRIVEKKTGEGKTVRCAILGVTSADPNFQGTVLMGQTSLLKDYSISNPVEALQKWVPELKKQADIVLVLAYGLWAEFETMAKTVPEIDAILCSTPTPDYNAKQVKVGPVFLLGQYSALGKQVQRVDFKPAADGRWEIGEGPIVLGVSPKILKLSEPLNKLIADYKQSTEKLNFPMPANVKAIYAGANSCVACHTKEYESWTKSQHYHAYQTLVHKGSQYDANCLKCHTVGFKHENGFYNIKSNFNMINVQCESCHGPGMDHVQRENVIKSRSIEAMAPDQKEQYLKDAKALLAAMKPTKETCIKCHYGENDPHFVYEEKVVKVNHKEQAVVAQPPTQP